MIEDADRNAALLRLRFKLACLEISDFEAWLRYLKCGGCGTLFEFEAYLHGALTLTVTDMLALDHSVWEVENL